MQASMPVTRSTIPRLSEWVDQITTRLPEPERDPLPSGGFRWRHGAPNADSLLVTKAVRIASGLRAALMLADNRHTVETGVILRTVADFSAEVMFIAEGVLEGRLTQEQAEFIEQHHAPLARTADEFAEREHQWYVGRKAIAKAQRRLAEKWGADPEFLQKLTEFLNYGYDSYVHGKYESAMELFSGADMRFMMNGTESDHAVCVALSSVAGKLGEALNAFSAIAIVWKMGALADDIRAEFNRLHASGEESGAGCI